MRIIKLNRQYRQNIKYKQTAMSQNEKLVTIPDISTSGESQSREGAVCDSLRFSYDVDLDSALEYSEDGRQIDFQFEDYPEYEFKNQDKNDTLDNSALNRKLQIFEKYRAKNQLQQPNRNSDIVDSFDKIFNINANKADSNPGKYLFKRKLNNEPQIQTKKQNKIEIQANNVNPVTQNHQTHFVLQAPKVQNSQVSQKDISTDLDKQKKEESNENIKEQELRQNINSLNSTENKKGQLSYDGSLNELSISNVSINSAQSSKSDFQLRQLNFTNPFNNSTEAQEIENKNIKMQKQARQAIQTKINNFLSGTNNVSQPPSQPNKPEQIEYYLSKLSISKPLSTSSVGSSSNSKTLSQSEIQASGVSGSKLEFIEKIPPPLSISKVSTNENVDSSTRLANPIFDEENRIAPLFKKIRKMNSIYPNFNHPAINLDSEAKFCNVLATVFEDAFLFLQKMTIKALQKAKQPKYFPAQFASLNFFLNSGWEYERYKQWEVLSITLKPRSNFPRNDIQQSKIMGALANYKEVIQYYKEKKMELNSEQSIKNYFKIRQKFWSLERNLRSISQDVYRIYQDTEFPQFYYDYLKILRSPLPAKNDEQTITHHQKVLRILIMNRQRMEPLSCSEVGNTVKIKLQRELKFLCPF